VNVYDHIAANTRKTIALLCAFPAALFVTAYLFAILYAAVDEAAYVPEYALQITLMIYPLMILAVSIWIAVSLYKGDKMVLGMTHARRVTVEENRELFRLVENTAIMAGLPTPEIYLIEDESLNAFATGRNPGKASIALTKGIVEKLNKAELQAVIAHELAHIGNRDTLLMLITVAGIGCFLFLGEMMIRGAFAGGRRSSRGDHKATVFLLFLGIFCFVFGYLVAPVLRFALSRRREYQADATAVQITRDPVALARALAKIAYNPKTEVLTQSSLVGNMCIVNPAGYGRLYCTHPLIKDRIAALGIDASDIIMPDEVPEISDISKSRARILWFLGAFGTLGFHYFAVSRIFVGIIRSVYGLFIWCLLIACAFDKSMPRDSVYLFLVLLFIVLLFAPSMYDIIKIRRGTFKDSKGVYLKHSAFLDTAINTD